MAVSREVWASTRFVAIAWWCGDEVCDCTQAQIDKVTPNVTAGYPWIARERVWEGEFFSDGEPGAREELRACRAFYERWLPEVAARIEWPSYSASGG
jgi:hypothetical protein